MNCILTEQRGSIGLITLNRPKALNALNLEMVQLIGTALDEWESDESVRAVLFIGAGDRAFCAGGDLKDFYTAKAQDNDYSDINVPEIFFGAEYRLNHRIFNYPKPTIAFMDGVVMGGGFGIGGHCDCPITTPKTMFSMPETAIGFFPDIAAMYHLTRSPDAAGRYIALTADRLNAEDMHEAHLATHHIADLNAAELMDVIDSAEDIGAALDQYSSQPQDGGVLSAHATEIGLYFGCETLEGTIAELEESETPFAQKTLAILKMRAPLSLAVTAEQYGRAQGKSFDAVIQQDFTLAKNFMRAPDIYEGIRAVLIDKDHAPQWHPAKLEDVDAEQVARYFAAHQSDLFGV